MHPVLPGFSWPVKCNTYKVGFCSPVGTPCWVWFQYSQDHPTVLFPHYTAGCSQTLHLPLEFLQKDMKCDPKKTSFILKSNLNKVFEHLPLKADRSVYLSGWAEAAQRCPDQ